MKAPIRLSSVIVVFILVSMLGIGLTQAQGYRDTKTLQLITSHANLPWSSQYIQRESDPPRDVGRYVSMALRPFDGSLAISYYDATNADLMVAIPAPNHSGNCGTSNNWLCDSMDGGGGLNTGMFTSIDIWGSSANNWKLGISYFDATNRALKAAIWTCSLGSCVKDIITVTAPDAPEDSIGLYSSFKFSSTGNAAIAYFQTSSPYLDSDLFYAEQVPSLGNCGEGAAVGLWNCTLISILNGEGRYASLDFNFGNTPYIAYYSVYDGQLRLAYHESSAAFCDEFDWTCLTLDGGAADVGYFASLIAPQSSDDPIRVAYYDKTNGYLKYYDSDWGEPVVVDGMGSSLDPMGISLALDNEGYPVIAYQQIVSDLSNPDLRIARPYIVYGTEPYGNCGDLPPGYLFQYWQCKTLDYDGQYSGEAYYASMAINSNGMVGIAYSEYDTYDYFMSLKFIYQHLFRTLMPITPR